MVEIKLSTIPGFRGAPSTTVQNSGTWYLDAYVQGKYIRLLIYNKVHSGDTIYFKDKEVSVDLYSTLPLSVFTIGGEDDSGITPDFCGIGIKWYDQIAEIFKGPSTNWYEKLNDIQLIENDEQNNFDDDTESQTLLGHINKLYPPPKYQAFPHSDTSSSGDFC